MRHHRLSVKSLSELPTRPALPSERSDTAWLTRRRLGAADHGRRREAASRRRNGQLAADEALEQLRYCRCSRRDQRRRRARDARRWSRGARALSCRAEPYRRPSGKRPSGGRCRSISASTAARTTSRSSCRASSSRSGPGRRPSRRAGTWYVGQTRSPLRRRSSSRKFARASLSLSTATVTAVRRLGANQRLSL